jgi:hypothetical protein
VREFRAEQEHLTRRSDPVGSESLAHAVTLAARLLEELRSTNLQRQAKKWKMKLLTSCWRS